MESICSTLTENSVIDKSPISVTSTMSLQFQSVTFLIHFFRKLSVDKSTPMEKTSTFLEQSGISFEWVWKAFRGYENETNLDVNVEPEDTKNVLELTDNQFQGSKLNEENSKVDKQYEVTNQQQIKSEEMESSSPTPTTKDNSSLKSKSLKRINNVNWYGKNGDFFKAGHHSSNFNLLTWSCRPLISKRCLMGVPGISKEIKSALKNLQFYPDKAQFGQQYAWPHLASGGSMIMIAHERRGKSWSYIPILCQRLYEATLIDGPPDWSGPKCIMLLANHHEILKASAFLLDILKFCASDKINTIVTLQRTTDISEVISTLSKPCGILITTVELILKLIRKEKKMNLTIFHTKTIRCLILDNIGDMWYYSPLSTMHVIRWLTNKFVFTKQQTQLIIAGRLWLGDIMRSQIIPQLSDALLILEDGLEASFYGNIKLNINFVTQQDYLNGETLLKVLYGRDLSKERIVIICYQEVACRQIHKVLKSHDIPHIMICGQVVDTKPGIIIATDDVLCSLNCGPVDLMISYTLTHTWFKYKQRFNLFHANYMMKVKKPGEALIILSPSQSKDLWLFCDFLFKHDLDVPQNWLDRVYDYCLETELEGPRPSANLCQQVLHYGNCYRRRCCFRHVMTSDELKPVEHLPQQGEIHFRILNILSPSTLCIRILDEPYDRDNSLRDLDDSIQAFYKDEKNLINIGNPSVGDIIIINSKNRYERAIIISINFDNIAVKSLDWGTERFDTTVDQLFVCDERFRHQKNHAFDLILTGLMPQSMGRKWNEEAIATVRSRYFNSDGNKKRKEMLRNRIYTAFVKFTFQNYIHVDTIYSPKYKDLKRFVLTNLVSYEDKLAKDRLANILKNAQQNDAN